MEKIVLFLALFCTLVAENVVAEENPLELFKELERACGFNAEGDLARRYQNGILSAMEHNATDTQAIEENVPAFDEFMSKSSDRSLNQAERFLAIKHAAETYYFSEAQAKLGQEFLRGTYVKANPRNAKYYGEQAAAKGSVRGVWVLSEIYLRILKNETEARYWTCLGALPVFPYQWFPNLYPSTYGHANATNLMEMLWFGLSIQQDKRLALRLAEHNLAYGQAGLLQLSLAFNHLILMEASYTGLIREKNISKAKEHARKAFEMGNDDGLRWLAFLNLKWFEEKWEPTNTSLAIVKLGILYDVSFEEGELAYIFSFFDESHLNDADAHVANCKRMTLSPLRCAEEFMRN